MTVFVYDKTFEGLLTAVFDAYSRRSFPDLLLAEGEPFPLFYDEAVTICTGRCQGGSCLERFAEAAFRYGFVCDYRYLAI